MKKRSIPAFILFLYDCARLGFMLALTKDQAGIPFVSANALFPVAGFFLFAGPQKYREYGPLYSAGKALGVFAILVWLFFVLKNGLPFALSPLFNSGTMVFFLLLLIVTDTLSLVIRFWLDRRIPQTDKRPIEPPAEHSAGGVPAEPTDKHEPFRSVGDIANCE